MIHRFLRGWRNGYHRRCVHRSHRLRLPCYRPFTSDGFCGRHNDTCRTGCDFSDSEFC